MTHGSLFSGIEGFALGAQMSGIETKWSCEIDENNRKRNHKNFPHAKQYTDIRELNHPEPVDIISGGFPCQDISIAGKGTGITGTRSGLWSEFYRLICQLDPAYVLIENSPRLLQKGFEKVLYDLSEIGYDAEWQCLFASQFGYPHRRERIYVIAYRDQKRCGTIQLQQTERCKRQAFQKIERVPAKRDWHSLISQYSRDINGIPAELDRVAACGNAVIPDIAHYLFECIKQHAA